MTEISFNVDAYTARVIGRENISGIRGALFELIKNGYDADASIAFLYYSNGCLFLGDNGTGMNEQVIKNNWMTIGRSTKKHTFTTSSGRIQTGAKGIGRFALDRLGDYSEMLTKSIDSNDFKSLIWKVNWGDFEKKDNITDVHAILSNSKISFLEFLNSNNTNDALLELIEKNFTNTGTIFKISNLRESWEEDNFIDNIRMQLSTLIPENISEVFDLYFFTDSTNVEEAKIVSPIEDDFDYKVSFKVKETVSRITDNKDSKFNDNHSKSETSSQDDKNKSEVEITILRNEFDFGKDFEKIITEAGFTQEDKKYFKNTPIVIKKSFSEIFKTREEIENTIGKFSGELYFSKISYTRQDREKYYYKSNMRNKVSNSFAGIKLYRDNFRVRPYGEFGTSSSDWLLLSARKQNSPAAVSHPTGKWRVSSNQINGSVFISRLNLTLPDQSNREGIIETDEFKLFKNFITEAISYFEEDRQYVFRKLSTYYDAVNEAARIQKDIEWKAKKEAEEKAKKEAEEKDKEETNSQEAEESDQASFLLDEPIVDEHIINADNKDMQTTKVRASDAQKVIDHKDSIIQNLQDENKMLRALATTGIVTNTYIHEIKGITHDLNINVIGAFEELTLDNDVSSATESLIKAMENKESLNSWFEVTLSSIRKDKRNWKKIELNGLLINLVQRWERILSQKDIKINFSKNEDDVYFYCHSFEIESIINNLFTNSFYAFSSPIGREKKINISLYSDDKNIHLFYEDNGPGLPPAYKENPKQIMEAMESEKRDENGELIGTGMGMWIIDKTISDYKGTISLTKNMTASFGFSIEFILPKGSRK